MMLLMAATVAATVDLYIKIPKGFFPQQDTGRLSGIIEGQQHISYRLLVEKAKWFEQQVRSDPDVETVDMVAGTSGGGFGGNQAQIWLQLKDVGVRKSTVDQVIDRLRAKTGGRHARGYALSSSVPIRISASAEGNPTASINISCMSQGFATCSANGGRRFWSECANFLR